MADLRVLIADDERLARARLQRLLGTLPWVRLVESCVDGASVLEALETCTIDCLILDLRMPGIGGAEVAELVGQAGPHVVFLTAHAEHAVTAFEQGAVDYLLKPVSAQRLEQALSRVRDRITPVLAGPPGKLVLPTATGAALIPVESILWCGIDGESVAVHAERVHYTDLRLADLTRRLPDTFLRLHRQVLVNVDRIVRLERLDSGGYQAHLDDGSQVPVSRAAARRLREQWGMPH